MSRYKSLRIRLTNPFLTEVDEARRLIITILQ